VFFFAKVALATFFWYGIFPVCLTGKIPLMLNVFMRTFTSHYHSARLVINMLPPLPVAVHHTVAVLNEV
jgi:hypothetical protein